MSRFACSSQIRALVETITFALALLIARVRNIVTDMNPNIWWRPVKAARRDTSREKTPDEHMPFDSGKGLNLIRSLYRNTFSSVRCPFCIARAEFDSKRWRVGFWKLTGWQETPPHGHKILDWLHSHVKPTTCCKGSLCPASWQLPV